MNNTVYNFLTMITSADRENQEYLQDICDAIECWMHETPYVKGYCRT